LRRKLIVDKFAIERKAWQALNNITLGCGLDVFLADEPGGIALGKPSELLHVVSYEFDYQCVYLLSSHGTDLQRLSRASRSGSRVVLHDAPQYVGRCAVIDDFKGYSGLRLVRFLDYALHGLSSAVQQSVLDDAHVSIDMVQQRCVLEVVGGQQLSSIDVRSDMVLAVTQFAALDFLDAVSSAGLGQQACDFMVRSVVTVKRAVFEVVRGVDFQVSVLWVVGYEHLGVHKGWWFALASALGVRELRVIPNCGLVEFVGLDGNGVPVQLADLDSIRHLDTVVDEEFLPHFCCEGN